MNSDDFPPNLPASLTPLQRAHVCLIYLRLASRWAPGRYPASACDRGRKLRGKCRVTQAPRNFPAISLQFPGNFPPRSGLPQ